jgi:hypothetical protein
MFIIRQLNKLYPLRHYNVIALIFSKAKIKSIIII